MKLYKNEMIKTQGSSYIAFIINEKDSKWIDKGKEEGEFINFMLLKLFKDAYPRADITPRAGITAIELS